MAISSIHDWLTRKGEFTHGVDLLKLHGAPTPAQLVLFGMAESTFSRAKLVEALRKVNDAAVVPSAHRGKVQKPGPVIVPGDEVEDRVHKRMLNNANKDLPIELLPKELRPVRELLKQQWREFTYARGRMENIPDGMHLREAAEHVLDLRQKMRHGWWRIEHWHKTGSIVQTNAQKEITNPVDLLRRERKLSTWLSQRKPGAKNQRRSTPEEFEAKKMELDQVRKLIKQNAVPA